MKQKIQLITMKPGLEFTFLSRMDEERSRNQKERRKITFLQHKGSVFCDDGEVTVFNTGFSCLLNLFG